MKRNIIDLSECVDLVEIFSNAIIRIENKPKQFFIDEAYLNSRKQMQKDAHRVCTNENMNHLISYVCIDSG